MKHALVSLLLLIVMVESDSQTTSWTVPPYKDEAVEALVKRSYAANPKFRGIVIVKSGMDYTTWKLFKNDLGIPTSQIKMGRILVKIPNQQGMCQSREFAVEKSMWAAADFRRCKWQGSAKPEPI